MDFDASNFTDEEALFSTTNGHALGIGIHTIAVVETIFTGLQLPRTVSDSFKALWKSK